MAQCGAFFGDCFQDAVSNLDLLLANPNFNKDSLGGTEIMCRLLYDGTVPRALLEKINLIPSRVRHIDPNKLNVLVLHDLPEDPEAQFLKEEENVKKFDAIVFVSNWQREQFHDKLGLKYQHSIVIENAITPFPDSALQKPKDGPIRLIYTPTPHRGLEILVPVFESLVAEGHDIVLDVFSSFELYGWGQRDAPYQALFSQCRSNPRITYHGARPNAEVRAALEQTHIFAYPSIWKETSCLCLIEAMSAGCSVVAPFYGALTETSCKMMYGYPWGEDMNMHANMFKFVLKGAINNLSTDNFTLAKRYIDGFHNETLYKQRWEALLIRLIQTSKA